METGIKNISFMDISINNGFWNNRQQIISDTTIYAVWNRFKETGRFEAFNFNWAEGNPNKPHIFWDSDIAKWIESVAFILTKKVDKTLESTADEIIDLIQKHQDENGYFNIYFTVVEPEQRWKRRTEHELYCAGHLIEAAIAYYNTTGKQKLLNLMRKYADHIEKVFKIDGSAAFTACGHEEIELALVKLYRCTGEKRYLELSKFFIDNRGLDAEEQYYPWANALYSQDHLPVRQQRTAEGHAVRAVYLYSAMADLALDYGDEELFTACRGIFENIIYRKMYITGGIGSSAMGEAFTVDYDLPNLTAYTETCAAIGLALFTRRMLLLDVDSIYSDITERLMYNGLLSGISLDGKSFFYENPLEVQPALVNSDVSIKEGKRKLPPTQRKEVFECSCCPPNLTRFISSIGDFLYTYNQTTLFVHHYMSSETQTSINGIRTDLVQKTDYPLDGKILFTIKGNSVSNIAFRIPSWCENFSFRINGNEADVAVQKGYAYIKRTSSQIDTLEIQFDMKVQLIEASPNVQENSGRVALQRGPFIYCLEAIDNGDLLRDIRIDEQVEYELINDDYFGVPLIMTTGYRRKADGFKDTLYKTAASKFVKTDLKFIPYYGFANRGESEMLVWILKK